PTMTGKSPAAPPSSGPPSSGTSKAAPGGLPAAVIGGASLAGGRGAVTGTLLGTVLMVLITNAGTAFQIDPYILDVTTGVLIIFAVAMDMIKTRKKA
ncbi:MAG: ABC transporter permease, partial [Clostridiales bacterium]|nr:ABC transporter permease [Clostridiales bacterium]